MLAADKNALERELRLNMLNLQWKELEYLHTNFQNLAVCSAVLVGFGVASFGISSTFTPEDRGTDDTVWSLDSTWWHTWYMPAQICFEALFTFFSSIAMAWNLLTLFIATLSVMCGPGMALRGQEGSVSIAVRHLESMLKRALRFFGRGIFAFAFSMVTIGLRQVPSNHPAHHLPTLSPACPPHRPIWSPLAIGFRQIHTIAFLGGGGSILIGLFTVYGLWT